MNFRKDINGLRAIAVIAVIIFHFYPSVLPGGFAGVDVFFVISGYLMTSIIFGSIEKETFSVTNFYLARANRIIPPLAVLCLTLLILGFMFLPSWDYKTLGRDVASSISFSSNVIFSLRRGYFESGESFLLHTWSLSTEWQFYILYPIFLILLKKWAPTNVVNKFILVTAIVGFTFSVYATIKWPVHSFFLLPMRAWEMLLGGLAFIYPFPMSSVRKKTSEWLGLLLIITSYIFVNETVLWPGYMVIFPVAGSFLVILSARDSSLIMNNVVFQYIGKWSYSIYLWHWPIAVSYMYFGLAEGYKYIGIGLSLVFGWLSYILVEKSTFFKKNSWNKNIVLHSCIIIFLGSAGSFVFKTSGIGSRDILESNSLIQGGIKASRMISEGETLINTDGKFDYLLLGDSNASHYTRGIIYAGDKVKLSWFSTCLSFPTAMSARDGYYPNWKNKCKNNFKFGLNESNIIIAQSWNRTDGTLECTVSVCNLVNNYYENLSLELSLLFDYYGGTSNIYLVGELPKPKDVEFIKCLRANILIKANFECQDTGHIRDDVTKVNIILEELSGKFDNVHYIDMSKSICNREICTYSREGKALFLGDNHLSGFGSEIMWSHIMSEIFIIADAIK